VGILSDLKSKVKRGVERTEHKSKQVLEISRLTILIRGKRETEQELYRRLGREVYAKWQENETEALKWGQVEGTLKEVDQVRKKIAELEKELEGVKNSRVQYSEPKPQKAASTPNPLPSPDQDDASSQFAQPETEERVNANTAHPSDGTNGTVSQSKAFEAAPYSTNAVSKKEGELQNHKLGGLDEGMAIFICPHCGDQVDEDTEICPHCQKNIYQDDWN
jgi:rubrerythrin